MRCCDAHCPCLVCVVPVFLQKSVLFRGGADVKSDERSALVYRMLTMPVAASKAFIQPLLLPLHRLEPDDCRPSDGAVADEPAGVCVCVCVCVCEGHARAACLYQVSIPGCMHLLFMSCVTH